ncbi:hypothetical protein WKK05_39230 (plasmid) [Nostoc sp. UHCC 0302]|uniref:hypothetical protein n=1 Tax=Nostoc sp. UHCC 0302 TaxID=3134896 RepID=UPI00311CC5FE
MPSQQPNFDGQQKYSSYFRETRFQNVLTRAALLERTNWFWHRGNSTQISDHAVAIIACSSNDFKQILIKQNQLANTVFELDPQAELLLLVSPELDFVFGTVLETGEMFSTHILFTQSNPQDGCGSKTISPKELAINSSVSSTALVYEQGRSLTAGGIS